MGHSGFPLGQALQKKHAEGESAIAATTQRAGDKIKARRGRIDDDVQEVEPRQAR
ncbi:hypothetical protein GCM10022419_009890 [Nonomuraea rosea]|uniref:CsbD family protein n=1 Tax=Nonomuraea rosea TaxID=638574 RepID=A0ABP6VBR8_9ACTN